jgi:hypothetical protein
MRVCTGWRKPAQVNSYVCTVLQFNCMRYEGKGNDNYCFNAWLMGRDVTVDILCTCETGQ